MNVGFVDVAAISACCCVISVFHELSDFISAMKLILL